MMNRLLATCVASILMSSGLGLHAIGFIDGTLPSVLEPPQPEPKTLSINAGSTAAFTVATNLGALSYQWQYQGTNLPGATNSLLLMENVSTNQAGTYNVVIGTAEGSLTSSNCSLIVRQGTIVRFRLATGDVDVELFDQDKPVTVQNFLHYVKAGIYTNAFFQRLVTNFCLQAGGYGTLDRSTNLFVPNRAMNLFTWASTSKQSFNYYLINEFDKGPRVRNTFGTLAMARMPGITNSASSQWFFNLTNNSSYLDNVDGGFTVFGRVINGADTLAAFNNLSTNNGIIDLSKRWPTNGGSSFPNLPYQPQGTNLPRNSDLYYANISLVTKPVYDTVPPKIAITYPPNRAVLTNGNFTIRGTASDNNGIGLVWCWLRLQNSQSSMQRPPIGTTNWSLPVNLFPGLYTTHMQVWDGYGNTKFVESSFLIKAPLAASTQGQGTVSPNMNGQYLEVGNSYTMTALPKAGQLFAGWFDKTNLASMNPKLTFTMKSGLSLSARFVTNCYPSLKGTYSGLFCQTNAISATNVGLLSLTTVGSTGAYSGKLYWAGKTLLFKGAFDPSGVCKIPVKVPGTTNLISLSMRMDLTNNTGMITGLVSSLNWTSTLCAYRGMAKLSTNTAPMADNYVLNIPGDLVGTNQPAGDGYATITCSTAGALTVKGALADNTVFTESVTVSKEGFWPLYSSLYSGKGLLFGWQKFDSGTNCAGDLLWIKPAATNGLGGISATIDSQGQDYVPPVPQQQYKLTLSGGSLAVPISYVLTASATRQLSAPGVRSAQFNITFTPLTGAFSGQFASPTSTKPLPFKGVFQNPIDGGSGFFIDQSGRTGFLQITPAP